MGIYKLLLLAIVQAALVVGSPSVQNTVPDLARVDVTDMHTHYHGRLLQEEDMELAPGPSSSQGSSKLSSSEYSPPNVVPRTVVPVQGVPTLNRIEYYTQGPVDVENIMASASSDGSCMTIGEVLKSIGATKWYDLLADGGFKTVLLDPKDVQATLLVPVDQAFFTPINGEPLRSEKTMDELVYYAPDIKKPLAGASILPGLWPSDSLGTSMRIPSSNSIGMNPLNIIVGEDKVLTAENGKSTANIVQKDILACGPSIIHLTDNILLPFSFQDAPKDAIIGQQSV